MAMYALVETFEANKIVLAIAAVVNSERRKQRPTSSPEIAARCTLSMKNEPMTIYAKIN
jgi:hypothetical protein